MGVDRVELEAALKEAAVELIQKRFVHLKSGGFNWMALLFVPKLARYRALLAKLREVNG